MAVYEGTFSARPHTLRLTVVQSSQDIADNESVVSWSLQIIKHPSWSSYSFYANPWSVTINGVTISGTFTYDFRAVSSVTLGSGTRTIPHNADGTKTISVSASASGNASYLGSASCSGTLALTTIPRASNPTFSASPADAGSTITINTNRASSAFTHTIEYAIGAASGTIGTGIGVSTTWIIPITLLNEMPSSPTGNVTITTKTYDGATLIGTTTKTLVIKPSDSTIPDFTTITHVEATAGIAALIGGYVQGVSTLTLAITGAVGVYGSTITAYEITVAGQTIATVSGTTPSPISASGTVVITGKVTDSRGKTRTRTVNITVLARAIPQITSLVASRADAGGTISIDDGDRIRLDMNISVSSLIVSSVEKNALTYKVYTRLKGATTWDLQDTVTPGGISFNSYDVFGVYAAASAWEVRLDVLDVFGTPIATINRSIPVASIFMHWDSTLGVGINKFRENGVLDVGGQIYQRSGKRVLDIDDYTEIDDTLVELLTRKLSGLVPITPSSVAGGTILSDGWIDANSNNIDVQGVFSANFRAYKMLHIGVTNAQVGLNLQLMNSSGTVSAGTNYDRAGNTTQGDSNQLGQNAWIHDGGASAHRHSGEALILNPFEAANTHFLGSVFARRDTSLSAVSLRGGYHRLTSSYTGVRLSTSNGTATFTGLVRFYGLA